MRLFELDLEEGSHFAFFLRSILLAVIALGVILAVDIALGGSTAFTHSLGDAISETFQGFRLLKP